MFLCSLVDGIFGFLFYFPQLEEDEKIDQPYTPK